MDVTNRVFALNTRARRCSGAGFALARAMLMAALLGLAGGPHGAAAQDSAQTPPEAAGQGASVPQEGVSGGTDGAADGGAPPQMTAEADDQVDPSETGAQTGGPTLGPETNLPLPRFVSLKAGESNVRRGPSLSHRIDWVFMRRDMPLLITAEYGHWRRVTDREGLGGWVHYSLLSGTRTVIVDQDMLPLLARPDDNAPQNALLENGVIARLGECNDHWCRLSVGGYRGWARKSVLWGVEPDELRD